jgi:UDP-glucose 4-epimerase
VRVAVTGARGFLGRPIVAALACDERVEEVVAIDLRPPGGPIARVRQIRRDTRDPRLRRDLAGVDALMHLAFRTLRGADAVRLNVEGSRAAFDAAVEAGASTIVHASSVAAYGSVPDNAMPLREEDPLRAQPPFDYPHIKVTLERMLDDLALRNPDVRVVRMRPTRVLGPGAQMLLAGRVLVTPSDFDPPMQFTWIDDVVAAFLAALRAPTAAGPFNVGAPGAVRASQVAELIGVRSIRLPYRVWRAAAVARSRLRLPGAVDPGFVDSRRYPLVVDSGRAERELGWRAEHDVPATLRRFGDLVRGGRAGGSHPGLIRSQ